MTRCTSLLLTLFVVLGTGVAHAQDPELVTDRPDFTESSDVVRRGLAQFETGVSYERTGPATDRTGSLTVPSSLARIGLSRRVELRLGSDGFLSQTQGGVDTHGWADFEAGVKVRLLDQDKAGFDMAVIPMLSLPTGKAGFTSDHVDPTVKITWARELPAGFGLSGNYNISSLSDDFGRFTQQALSFSMGHDLVAGWGGYFEGFGFMPGERDADAAWTLNGGISHKIGSGAQVDMEVGRGVGANASDWFVGAGFAIRWHTGAKAR